MGDGGAVVIVVFCSQSGSPGVSVWSVLTAGLWPSDDESERVVVEADLGGGVMCARYRLEARTEELLASVPRWNGVSHSLVLADVAARVESRAWLVPGPVSSEAATRSWRAAGAVASLATVAASDRRVWLFDVGRAEPDGVLAPLFEAAACVVVFVRGASEELARSRSRIAAAKRTGAHVVTAITGSSDHGRDEVSEFLGCSAVHELPGDGRLVEDSRQVWSSQRPRRRSVWAAGSALAGAISEVLTYSPRGLMRVVPTSGVGGEPSSNGDVGAPV